MTLSRKTIDVFDHPFSVPGFDETFPVVAYDLETEECAPRERLNPEVWKASFFVKLHTQTSHSGLTRVLVVSLSDLERARATDKASGKALTDFLLEEMLSDPLVLLVMPTDGVSDAQLYHLHSGSRIPQSWYHEPHWKTEIRSQRVEASIRAERMKTCRSERDVQCRKTEVTTAIVAGVGANAARHVYGLGSQV